MRSLLDRFLDWVWNMHVKAEAEHKRRLAEYFEKHPDRRY